MSKIKNKFTFFIFLFLNFFLLHLTCFASDNCILNLEQLFLEKKISAEVITQINEIETRGTESQVFLIKALKRGITLMEQSNEELFESVSGTFFRGVSTYSFSKRGLEAPPLELYTVLHPEIITSHNQSVIKEMKDPRIMYGFDKEHSKEFKSRQDVRGSAIATAYDYSVISVQMDYIYRRLGLDRKDFYEADLYLSELYFLQDYENFAEIEVYLKEKIARFKTHPTLFKKADKYEQALEQLKKFIKSVEQNDVEKSLLVNEGLKRKGIMITIMRDQNFLIEDDPETDASSIIIDRVLEYRHIKEIVPRTNEDLKDLISIIVEL